MAIKLIDPANGEALGLHDGDHAPEIGAYPVVNGVPRLCGEANYTDNFGLQWNRFPLTQIDREDRGGSGHSSLRFFTETGWKAGDLDRVDVLEVGSGAGRFSNVVLEQTNATLWSVDYSSAVEANWKTNGAFGPDRFHLFQASIYEMPFPDGSFDKVFCLGVLQHTPDFAASVRALVAKAKSGGEIVVDFYPIRGFWTKINAKYILRPLTKRMSNDRLLDLIDRNADWLIGAAKFLDRIGLHALTRFLPICDIRGTLPAGLSRAELREWVVLDTFDQYSPEFDSPQRIADVVKMFEQAGAEVSFSGFLPIGENGFAAVVRGVKC